MRRNRQTIIIRYTRWRIELEQVLPVADGPVRRDSSLASCCSNSHSDKLTQSVDRCKDCQLNSTDEREIYSPTVDGLQFITLSVHLYRTSSDS